MEINYSDQKIIKNKKSIYLTGPVISDEKTPSWRREACKKLEELGFDGVVYVPEISTKEKEKTKEQENWESIVLLDTTIICFWIPKETEEFSYTDSALDFGYWLSSRKVLYGTNAETKKTRYLDWLYRLDYKRGPVNNLEDLLKQAIETVELLSQSECKDLRKIKRIK